VGELASKSLMMEGKKYYIDVKESRRGRFVKISEMSVNGGKNRMTMEMKTAIEFHDKLTELIDYVATLGPKPRTSFVNKIKSETIFATDRRYYLDLKESNRGRFLKVAMTMPPPSCERTEVQVLAEGMVDLRDALTDLLNEFGQMSSDIVTAAALKTPAIASSTTPTSVAAVKEESGRILKTRGKTFYFSVDNKHGVQLKISEVRPNFRTAVSIPQPVWSKFRQLLHSVTGVGGGTVAEEEPVAPHEIIDVDDNDD